MREVLGVFSAVVLFPFSLSVDFFPEFIIWNVGQGQWLTVTQDSHCYHFDAGGEANFWKEIKPPCKSKKNIVLLTHFDWDHVSALKYLAQNSKTFCIYRLLSQVVPPKRQSLLDLFETCAQPFLPPWLKVYHLSLKQYPFLDENDRSLVFVLFKKILIPGDATHRAERLWIEQIAEKNKIELLVVGHHGSKTSTSIHLLNALPNLIWAAASARKMRYGHPHPDTLKRLHDKGVTLLTTEQWGHLQWRLPL